MITKLRLANFKSFNEERTFHLKKINVFTGYNGRGKSTVLQSLLLLSQSVISKGSFEKLHLNGDWISLGDFDEIWNTEANDNINTRIRLNTDISNCNDVNLEFTVSSDDKVAQLCACVIDGKDLFSSTGMVLAEESVGSQKKTLQSMPTSLTNLFKDFHFISANRCGPIKYVDKLEIPDYHRVGKNGDLTINTLASCKVESNMIIHKGDRSPKDLTEAASRWIAYIMDGGDLQVRGDKKESSVLSVDFTNPVSGKHHRAENVGFGYSYILSIVVTALVAKQGSTVIIENPEAHLHPKAQSRITHLLTRLAERGVQVMLETHSEHILNGFRLCALKDNFDISNEDLSIYFFDTDYSSTQLDILPNGRISNWPTGFFDQQENDLAEIMRLGAARKQ